MRFFLKKSSPYIIATAILGGLLTSCESTSETDTSTAPKPMTLKEAFADDFLIGATLNGWILRDPNHPSLAIAAEDFATITSANALKWGPSNPNPGEYNLGPVDTFVEFGTKNNLDIVGHVLFWHSQTPAWVYQDDEGNQLTREALLARMRERSQMLADRYGDRIKTWDVVNEAIEGDGSMRKSKFHEIIGDDWIEQAFIIADETFPKSTKFLYNDYGMTSPGRRDAVVAMVNDFKSRGVRIDGIGVQGHWSMHRPSLKEIDDSLSAFASTGVQIHVTELDVDYLGRDDFFGANVDAQTLVATPENNPHADGNFPPEADERLADRYAELFELLLSHSDSIERVTFWGTTDADSWLNNWPVRGRTNYPLVIGRNGVKKPAYYRILELGANH